MSLNPCISVGDTKKYKGKVFSHFETVDGEPVQRLYMLENIVIVFEDGEKIFLRQDWRGRECYLTQRDR